MDKRDGTASGDDAGRPQVQDGATKAAFYFGSWGAAGHFLHDREGRKVWTQPCDVPRFPWTDGHMDTGLLINGRHADGRVFWTAGGPREHWPMLWHAFYWWDRSGDQRSNSNSGFYVWGFEHRQEREAFAFACEIFPGIVSRQKHPLVVQIANATAPVDEVEEQGFGEAEGTHHG